MNWSITPFIILAVVMLPFIIYLVVVRIRDIRNAKVAAQDKLDLILESTLTHDAYLRGSDTENKKLLVEIKETTGGMSTRLMDVINRLINGGRHE